MPRVPYQYPQPGSNAVADQIRSRRGARGLSPLDATLLNAPAIAEGWNKLIGTLRTGNSLPGDIRELMILRIAAIYGAAFEWLHHEHVGRFEGLTTLQLAAIADTRSADDAVLSPLQNAALAFTDASTLHARVPNDVFETLKLELKRNLESNPGPPEVKGTPVTIDRQLVEATTTIGGYNLVARFLLALDVDGRASSALPFKLPPPDSPDIHEYPVTVDPGITLQIRVRFHPSAPRAPAIVFVNSLLTDMSMWDRVLDAFAGRYTLVTFDQRGHGRSPLPSPPSTPDTSVESEPDVAAGETPITLIRLAQDIALILDYLQLPSIHALVGVSQGGATALAFAALYPQRIAHSLVACDTQATSPLANIGAWNERVALAKAEGMEELARKTAQRWFGYEGSTFTEATGGEDWEWLRGMIARTSVDGFEQSVRSLQGYDLRREVGLVDKLRQVTLLREGGMKVLLLAGELDGKLPEGLRALRDGIGGEGERSVQFVEIKGSGHLPMLDNPKNFGTAVREFLDS